MPRNGQAIWPRISPNNKREDILPKFAIRTCLRWRPCGATAVTALQDLSLEDCGSLIRKKTVSKIDASKMFAIRVLTASLALDLFLIFSSKL